MVNSAGSTGRRPRSRPEPTYGDADQLQRRADAGGQVVGLLVQQPDHLGADRAAAEQRHPTRITVLRHRRSPHIQRQQIVFGLPPDDHPGLRRRATATTGGRGTWL